MLPRLVHLITSIRFLKPEIPATILSLYWLIAVLPDGTSHPDWRISLWLVWVTFSASLLHRYLIPSPDHKEGLAFLQKHKILLVRSITICLCLALILTFYIPKPLPFIATGIALSIYFILCTRFFRQQKYSPWRRLVLIFISIILICWSNSTLTSPTLLLIASMTLGIFLQNILLMRSISDARIPVKAGQAHDWQTLGMKLVTPLILIMGIWLMYHTPFRLTQRTVLFFILISLMQASLFFFGLYLFSKPRLAVILNWILLTPVFIL
ncbi:hypothetical protein [Dyadobacter tibetensis]|uniref:hypothetical protein n=1 Tax=Dyadobacter tibetensis TaxID=1211851 RepID=UPI00047061DB|nr:hypothetical protein [Dyadobacter tibetensis]